MRQIDCRPYYHDNGGHPSETSMPNTIDSRQEFRKKTGKKRETEAGNRKRKGERECGLDAEKRRKKASERDGIRGERGHTTNGLISQQCDLFALYSHKEPTLLCHYVTKKGVIAQQGPPVRLRTVEPWRRMVYGYGHRSFSLVSFSFSSIIDHPRGLANMPVIFPPFRISLYYFLPVCYSYRQ